jgi:hypothetical protein
MKVNSPNWHEHSNENGYKFLAFRPTSSSVDGNQDGVVLFFGDDQAGAGIQLWMSHQNFRGYVMALVKAREIFEAKLHEHGQEE